MKIEHEIEVDLDEIERKATAAIGKYRWRVVRCSHADEGTACAIKDEPLVSENEDAYQRGVCFDASYDECHHVLSLANAEHIAASDPATVLALVGIIRQLEAAASGDDCRAPGAQPCECCIARGGYQ